MKLIAALLIGSTAAWCGCVVVEGDKILARDLVGSIPEFAGIPAYESIGFAPSPGVRRTLSIGELARFAERFHVTVQPGAAICIEIPVESLSAERITAAMKQVTEADVQVIEFSRYFVPKGEVQFLKTGLAPSPAANPSTTVLWKGRVLYGNGKSWAIWARVKLAITREQLVAMEAIAAGSTISSEQVKTENALVYPFAAATMRADDVSGRIARQKIEKGQAITATLLLPRAEVRKGDDVEVRVESGTATLKIHAKAETSGRLGESVTVKNPESGKNFRAVVEGRNRVGVVAKGSTN
jgi:flagella basal body P-ring formation protein FlgA